MSKIIEQFYDETSPEIWKRVIGEDLHYHYGLGEGDIFFNAVKHLYQFIDERSSVLDCGCGWGGTGKVLKRDLDCNVLGVTNSIVQANYINNHNLFDAIHCDLHDYVPNKKFDVCLFLESFCHLSDQSKVLDNIKNTSNKIILRDYHLKRQMYPEIKNYLNRWHMNVDTKDNLILLFKNIGFQLTYFEEHFDHGAKPTAERWLHNLEKIDKIDKKNHLNLLELSSRFLISSKDLFLEDVGLGTFVFERHD